MERDVRRKKAHHRVNVDRKVWEQVIRGGRENFSGLVSSLLESYVSRRSDAERNAGEKICVDVTVDATLWTEASELARAQGMSLSHVLRDLLQEHLRKPRKGRSS